MTKAAKIFMAIFFDVAWCCSWWFHIFNIFDIRHKNDYSHRCPIPLILRRTKFLLNIFRFHIVLRLENIPLLPPRPKNGEKKINRRYRRVNSPCLRDSFGRLVKNGLGQRSSSWILLLVLVNSILFDWRSMCTFNVIT